MEGYLFDTSALSQYLNAGHALHAPAKLVIDGIPASAPKFVCTITVAEMHYGFNRMLNKGRGTSELAACIDAVNSYSMLDVTRHTAKTYAALKAAIASKSLTKSNGRHPPYVEDWVNAATSKVLQVGENDLWICAVAKERDLILVTGDDDFSRMNKADPSIRLLSTRSP